jgi:SAM-dependent methyltransferase
MPTAGWWEALWPDPAGLLRAIGIISDMEVIDLCSGDGWFTSQIAKIVRHVVAIDIDPALLEVARLRLAEGGCLIVTFGWATPFSLLISLHGRQISYSLRLRSTAFPIGRIWRVRLGSL